MVETLQSFDEEEKAKAHILLGIKVAHMLGRKMEEDDWASVYCRAKGIPQTGWSNLDIDVMHENLGVEHKMLCYRSKPNLAQACGTTVMHPSATRSIRVPSLDSDPNDAMRDILNQYGELIRQRTAKVAAQNMTTKPVDMRTGWLLWQQSLRQFLYFEERMVAPDPNLFQAEWVEREVDGASARKGSKNLWIYEKSSGRKRYSVTTIAGAKIQPYFDIPAPSNPHVHIFTVIGEHIEIGKIRVWLTQSTARDLCRIVGSLDTDAVSDKIQKMLIGKSGISCSEATDIEAGTAVLLREDAYKVLVDCFPGVSDEIAIRHLIEQMA